VVICCGDFGDDDDDDGRGAAMNILWYVYQNPNFSIEDLVSNK